MQAKAIFASIQIQSNQKS